MVRGPVALLDDEEAERHRARHHPGQLLQRDVDPPEATVLRQHAGVAEDGEPAEIPARPGTSQSHHAVPDEFAAGEDAHVEEPVVDELGPAEEVLSPVEPEREVGDDRAGAVDLLQVRPIGERSATSPRAVRLPPERHLPQAKIAGRMP